MNENFYGSELFLRAEQERAAGNIDRAVYFYEEQLKREPTDWVSCLILVDIYYNKCLENRIAYNKSYKKWSKSGVGNYVWTQYASKLQLAQTIMPPSELYRLEYYKSLTPDAYSEMLNETYDRAESNIRRILRITRLPRILYWIGIVLVILTLVFDWSGVFFDILLVIMAIATIVKIISFFIE